MASELRTTPASGVSLSKTAGTGPEYALRAVLDWSQSARTEPDRSVAYALKKQAASVYRLGDSVVEVMRDRWQTNADLARKRTHQQDSRTQALRLDPSWETNPGVTITLNLPDLRRPAPAASMASNKQNEKCVAGKPIA